MATLSVIILTRNVEKEIIPALKSAHFANEIILVDTGSTDRTLELSKPFATKVVKSSPVQNFARWRNEGAKAATGNWLLYLDSDERIPQKLGQEIIATINEPLHDSYTISRFEVFLGKHLDHWPDSRVLRLMKKESLVRWQGKLHEQPQIKGTIGNLRHQMIHLSHKNINEKVTNTLNWSRIEANLLLKANHPPIKGWRLFRIIFTEFFQRFFKQGLWKDGVEGAIESIYQSFSRFLTYVQLWQLQRKPNLEQAYKDIDKQILKEIKDS
jgi:glycosyltransferase involved in cell wall biosynthesis